MMRRGGFSSIELLVALALTAAVASAGLVLVTSSVGLVRSQIHLTEMQQATRAAELELGRALRAAGRGGLPVLRAGDLPHRGVAIEVRNNRGEGGGDRSLAPGWPGSPQVSPGSDVLIVRGVFDTPVYVVDYRFPEAYSATSGEIRLTEAGPVPGLIQDLGPLREILRARHPRPEALLLVGLGRAVSYGVAELEPARSREEESGVVLAFRTGDSELSEAFARLSGSGRFPAEMPRVAYVGILEELRYYIRDTESGPRLARARLYPGTEIPWRRLTGELKVDLAENVADLQVALGFDSAHAGGRFDSDPDSAGEDDRIVERPGGGDDDWLFNSAADEPLDPGWRNDPPAAVTDLHYVRVRLLSLAARPRPGLSLEPLERLEDRAYSEEPGDPVNGLEGRRRPRWISTLVVGPRSR